jgi:protein-glutamine gamma-glutamyltransferase
VWPFASVDPRRPDPRLEFDRRTERLRRREGTVGERAEFELATTAFAAGSQAALNPVPEGPGDKERLALLQMPGTDDEPPASGDKPLPRLAELAARWLAEAPSAAGRHAQARRLEQRLRDSGQFTYSLEGQHRDPAIDPIEDFVVNHPRGHCEYFATALALMLRSQSIPARVVVGYRTGEWIDSAGYFQVRQLNAHTWVEAYLRREDLPPEKADDPAWARGAWLRLDATPAFEGDNPAPWRHGWASALGWISFLWNRYVMDMDRTRQREAIYGPALEAIRTTASNLVRPAWWRDRLAELWRALGFRSADEPAESILGPLAFAALLAVLIFLAGYLLYRFVLVPVARAVLGRLGRLRRGGRSRVEFFRSLEDLLARLGLVRGPSQTQLEFAVRAGRALADRTGDRGVAGLPVAVAEAFYRVRFGGEVLDATQRAVVEQSLEQIAKAARGTKP